MLKNSTGFSLLEIIIALGIIALVSSIATIAYRKYLIRAHRLDAKMALLKVSTAMERYYTQHNSYQDATFTNLGISKSSKHKFYELQLITQKHSFIIKATPIGSQKTDRLCNKFVLNQIGGKSITGTSKSPIQECWS